MNRLLCLYSVIWLAGCATAPTHNALSDVEGVNKNLMPPREFVARMPKTGGHTISPDGTKMIYWQRSILPIHWWRSLIPFKMNYHIKTFAIGEVQKYSDLHKARDVHWSSDSKTIIYSTSRKHNGKYHNQLIARDITTTKSNKTELVPALSQQGQLVFYKRVKGSASEFIAKLYTSDKNEKRNNPAYYRINYKTNTYVELAASDPDIYNWIIDNNGAVVGRHIKKASGFDMQWAMEGDYKTLFSCNEDWSQSSYIGADNRFIYFLSNCLSDKVAVNRVNKQSYKIDTLYEPKNVDIESVTADKQSKLLFATTDKHTTEFIVFDKRFAFLQNWHKDQLSKTVVVLNGSDNGDKFILESSDLSGRQQWLVDTPTQQITPLEERILPDKQSRVGSYQAIEIPTGNGIPVQAFLARPNFIAPDIKIPTVVYLHGGPTARSYPGYNPEISFLTNRGYAVLVVNYHGSTGYGKNYIQLPVKDFASLPNSVSAAVDWLIDSGSADPDKIALMGGSYGGYLSLLMPSLDNRFACSIAINPVTNLSNLAAHFKQKYGEEIFKDTFVNKYHGDGESSTYKDWSPINQANYRGNKILLIHAENDRRVPIEQSTEFYKKFKSTNSIKFVTLANESHGLEFWTSRLRVLRESEKFLAQCIGGAKGGFDYYSIVEPLSRIHFLLFE